MEVKVTQADVDAAKELIELFFGDSEDFEPVLLEFTGGFSNVFSRHRIASQAELIEALEKIARAQCTSVDGRSDDLTDSWHYLKSIARDALAKAKGGA